MLTKAQSKYIRSLTQQKFRNEYKVFIAEGEKIALEWLNGHGPVQMIITTAPWAEQHHHVIAQHPEAELLTVKDSELKMLSSLQTPNKVMLIVPVPPQRDIVLKEEWCIALDELQDPGNMGTIIRIADWFGIRHIACAPGCVDVYNPKVVQSAMGSHLRVNIHHADLASFLKETPLPAYAATLDGKSVYEAARSTSGILIIGNESRGISQGVLALAEHKITIPRRGGAESLNAAVSAGILCAMLLPC